MKKEHCQAVVIRVTPDTTSGEALNIGVVVHSPAHAFVGARFSSSWRRVTDAFPLMDAPHLRRIAGAITRACESTYQPQTTLEGPLDVIPLLRRVIPEDDAGILLSAPLNGLTSDPARTLNELFTRFVVRGEPVVRPERDDGEVWRTVANELRTHGVHDRLTTHVVRGAHYRETFEHAWKNGHWHVARPLSFDLRSEADILPKAAGWAGRVRALAPESQETTVVLVVGLPREAAPKSTRDEGNRALELLREELADVPLVEVMREADAPALADRIARDLRHEPPLDA